MTRHGIVVVPEHRWREAAPRWAAAEQLGFDHAWTYDHLVWGGLPDSPSSRSRRPSPWPPRSPRRSASGCSSRRPTSGTPTCWPATPSPSTTRAAAASCSASARAATSTAASSVRTARSRQRVDRFHEFTELLGRLLAEDHVDHDGEFYATRDARTLPEPVRERVPLVVAGNGPRSVSLAARLGDAWATYGGKGDTVQEWFDHVATLVTRFDDECEPGRTHRPRPLPAARRLAPLRAGVGRPLRRDDRPRRRARLHRRRHALAAARRPVCRVTRRRSRPPRPPSSTPETWRRSGEGDDDHRVGRRLGRAACPARPSSRRPPRRSRRPGAATTRARRRRRRAARPSGPPGRVRRTRAGRSCRRGRAGAR